MPYDSEDAYSDSSGRDSSSTSSSSKSSKTKARGSALAGGLSNLSSRENDAADRAASKIGPVTYHRGGKVRKGGTARLLKGERVISRGKRKKVDRLMKREGMRMKARR